MYCPRFDHFVRFNADGSIGKCGHMVNAPTFRSWDDMQGSEWLSSVREQMLNDQWPTECHRCQITEPSHSIRLDSIKRHNLLQKYHDYVILGGVLDNICNSACQSCNSSLSTKIGSLESKNYIRINNTRLFDCIPMDRVVEIDINGGEPSASPNYQQLLENLPASVKILRINTNGSRMLPNIENLLNQGIHVILTLSLDGTGKVHDYVRWPITWNNYQSTIGKYQKLKQLYHNLTLQSWTTLHALNLGDFDNIKKFSLEQGLKHSWAYLDHPQELNVKYCNSFTLPQKKIDPNVIAIDINNQADIDAWITKQDCIRNINITDYL